MSTKLSNFAAGQKVRNAASVRSGYGDGEVETIREKNIRIVWFKWGFVAPEDRTADNVLRGWLYADENGEVDLEIVGHTVAPQVANQDDGDWAEPHGLMADHVREEVTSGMRSIIQPHLEAEATSTSNFNDLHEILVKMFGTWQEALITEMIVEFLTDADPSFLGGAFASPSCYNLVIVKHKHRSTKMNFITYLEQNTQFSEEEVRYEQPFGEAGVDAIQALVEEYKQGLSTKEELIAAIYAILDGDGTANGMLNYTLQK